MGNSIRCISALNQAAGRELSADELQQVFDSIKKTSRDLAAGRIKPGEGADLTSPSGLIQHAAELAAKDMIADRTRQRRNVELQVKALTSLQENVAAMKESGLGEVDAVRRLIANDVDGKSNQFSLEARAQGVSNLLKSRIQSTWDAMGNDFLGLVQNREKVKNLLSEMLGVETGDKLAKEGARAWKEATDDSLRWFNEKGGKIGHLDNWAFPQHHSQERIAKAGKYKWIADVYPRLALDRYTDLAGNRMTEVEIKKMLFNAGDSILTNGANKIVPGEYHGTGARSNRHADERQIHFKDAESALWYWETYGEKTVPDILLGHMESMAKDIAFTEHFGPNPDAAFRVLRDQAERSEKMADPSALDRVDKELARLDNLYDYAAGKTKPVANRAVAGVFDVLRNLNSAGKLGSAFWASLYGDKVMLEAVSRLNNLPVMRNWYNEIRLLNPANAEERRLLQRQSLMLDYMQSAMYRFGDEMGRSSWTGKLSNAVMKVSGMSAINEWRRGAFGLSMMSAIGHEVSSRDWRAIGDQDMHILKTFGINEGDWKIWKLAQLEDYGHGNSTMLTPEGIARIPDEALTALGIEDPAQARRDAIVKYLGALHSESRNAVIEPGWSERAMMVGGLQRGNLPLYQVQHIRAYRRADIPPAFRSAVRPYGRRQRVRRVLRTIRRRCCREKIP